MRQTFMTWMTGFLAGLVVAIVLGVGAYRAARSRVAEPAGGERRPNPMQLRPKQKSNKVRLAFAAATVAS